MSCFVNRVARTTVQVQRQLHTSSVVCKRRPQQIVDNKKTHGRLEDLKQNIWEKQFVIDHFEIPGKFQKYFTGRLRKREAKRLDRQINGVPQTDELVRIGPRKVVVDENAQLKKMEMLQAQITRILEDHLTSDDLPVRQLSLQYWEITNVLVSFNLKSVVCCYKVTMPDRRTDSVKPQEVRQIIQESSEYLNAVVNQELAGGPNRRIGTNRAVRIKFTNGSKASEIIERMEAELLNAE
ncbi:hypothetical protein GGH19_004306 [Coemansia sp. RSA 1807]|nr:hypothetical protein LPJ58_002780 [Coemansia sp. RSA 1591]KAJ1762580.1 hypothetical protein LPJ69_002737 [Coemansia sp. RSA 1752]KAJ1788975.1 hypothetical protein LPJ67_002675 [Coemansia sp. RSA 1938]KAJ2144539.1 hypothetical protein IW142_003093 [Coemansia sp. RSA 564]KAJ2190663.1 hypothetical protein EV181_000876 [Coemansia sp. RSA 532]KAJ2198797.1 hypothetical protein GGH18_000857 [Coemansia sp. RSA 530]KAJ2200289.1 hypothetical protein IW144_001239 [Coemansia sp. RSA 522]KAJ2208306.1 